MLQSEILYQIVLLLCLSIIVVFEMTVRMFICSFRTSLLVMSLASCMTLHREQFG